MTSTLTLTLQHAGNSVDHSLGYWLSVFKSAAAVRIHRSVHSVASASIRLATAVRPANLLSSAVAVALSSSSSFIHMSASSAAPAPPATVAASSAAASSKADLWDPTQYLMFDEARLRPSAELLARVVATQNNMRLPSPKRIVDLGCGPGKQALMLARTFPQAQVTGIDGSGNMVAAARAAVAKESDESVRARVNYEQATFEGFEDSAGVDLLYSNAALHWARSDTHSQLFPHLLKQVRPDGGILAVQVPNNFRAPSHRCIRQALEAGKFFADKPEELERVWALCPSVHLGGAQFYFHTLAPHARHVDAWESEVQQLLTSPTEYHPVLEWTKSTALAPILAALPSDEERTRFQQIYSELLEKAYPYFDRNGKRHVLFPFKRIFVIAVR